MPFLGRSLHRQAKNRYNTNSCQQEARSCHSTAAHQALVQQQLASRCRQAEFSV